MKRYFYAINTTGHHIAISTALHDCISIYVVQGHLYNKFMVFRYC